jgi:hypothetical protein
VLVDSLDRGPNGKADYARLRSLAQSSVDEDSAAPKT